MAFFDLAGQTAIVTGGAQGIGEGIVHRLANAGAQVAVAGKSFDGARAVAEPQAGACGPPASRPRLSFASLRSLQHDVVPSA